MTLHRNGWRDSDDNIRRVLRRIQVVGILLPLAVFLFWHAGAGLYGSAVGDSGTLARFLLKQALAVTFVLLPAAWLEGVRPGFGTLLLAAASVISLNATVLLGTGTSACDIPLPLLALSPLLGVAVIGLFLFLQPIRNWTSSRRFKGFAVTTLLAAAAFAAAENVRVWRQITAARLLKDAGWQMKMDRGIDVPVQVWSGTDADLSQLPHIGVLTDLKELSLWQDDITDDHLRHLSSLQQLERIDLRETSVTDNCVLHLQKLARLRYVHLEDTAVTPEAKQELQRSLSADFVH